MKSGKDTFESLDYFSVHYYKQVHVPKFIVLITYKIFEIDSKCLLIIPLGSQKKLYIHVFGNIILILCITYVFISYFKFIVKYNKDIKMNIQI